jgi:hypothetical protein
MQARKNKDSYIVSCGGKTMKTALAGLCTGIEHLVEDVVSPLPLLSAPLPQPLRA